VVLEVLAEVETSTRVVELAGKVLEDSMVKEVVSRE
jgi:hypothetical protein